MQTSKARNGSSEVRQKTSPGTPKSTCSTKSGGADPDSSTSKHTPTKSPTDKSSKVAERRSPRSPVTEKRRPRKLTELEAQISQLQDDLKNTKDQLASSESSKNQAQLEAEAIKKQLEAMTAKLEDSQNQHSEFLAAEESRLQELRANSQDRDHAWQSELEAIQKQHSADTAALASAMNEIHRLKLQLEIESEKASIELQNLKQDMEKLKAKLDNSEKAKAVAEAKVVETQQNLEDAKDRAWQSELEATQKQHSADTAALASAMNEIHRLKLQLEIESEKANIELQNLKQDMEKLKAKLDNSEKAKAVAEAKVVETQQNLEDAKDRSWQSELEAIQKQHSADTAALTSAMNEIHRLKLQLEIESEKANIELQNLKQDMEKLKAKLDNSEKAKAVAEAKVVETQQNLEYAKASVETARVEGSKLLELFRESISELEESKARVSSLEETVEKLHNDNFNAGDSLQLGSLESEVHQLRSALQAAEIKYEEEQARTTSQIQSAYEVADQIKCESQARESDLESALSNAKTELCELKANLLDKETKLQTISDINEELKDKLENTQVNQIESKLKADLMDKENELQFISEENEQLKLEMSRRETDNIKLHESAIAGMELAKAKEKEALLKLEHVTEEAEAAKVMSAEMEAELRKLRVQSDQWRKAAEAAANVLTTNNGRLVERTGSIVERLMESTFSDDLDDDSPKKKNGGVLRKFGLWKKNSK